MHARISVAWLLGGVMCGYSDWRMKTWRRLCLMITVCGNVVFWAPIAFANALSELRMILRFNYAIKNAPAEFHRNEGVADIQVIKSNANFCSLSCWMRRHSCSFHEHKRTHNHTTTYGYGKLCLDDVTAISMTRFHSHSIAKEMKSLRMRLNFVVRISWMRNS